MIYFCVKFQKDPLFGVNLTFFAPWLPWQRPPFWIFSTPQKLPHTTVDIPTKFHEVWWKESQNFLNPPFFVSMVTAAKFVQPIPIFLACLVPLDVDVVPIKFHQFLFWRVTCYDLFCVYHFFSILAVSMATAAILEKSTPKGTISHGICYSYKVS